MKINKFLPFVLILMCFSCNDSETKDVFMFSYFKNNGEDGLPFGVQYGWSKMEGFK
jgi:hypothetical protein